MQAQYHVAATQQVLGQVLAQHALAEVVDANIGQDSLFAVLGVDPHRHFCDPVIDRSLDYIESEYALIAALAASPGAEQAQRAAFGRLLHTVQDFYAHSNYVDLWLAQTGAAFQAARLAHAERGASIPTLGALDVDALDPSLLRHPQLRIGDWVFWRDLVFYIPLLGTLVRRFWVPPNSHEAMHLDSPQRGPRFNLALTMARLRTEQEYWRVVAMLYDLGGPQSIARFCGMAGLA